MSSIKEVYEDYKKNIETIEQVNALKNNIALEVKINSHKIIIEEEY